MGLLLAILLSPLMLGVINRTKAFFAGRTGQPMLQAYFDIAKLFRKSAVYSRTTTWIFRATPAIGLAAAISAAMLIPSGNIPAVLSFPGDFLLFAYFLGLIRFFMVLAALDTGSSFEGMGASREVLFSALAEPALLLGLIAISRTTHAISLSSMFSSLSLQSWTESGLAYVLVLIAFLIVFLSENARIPVDDPNTHLELTMIHEVMILDHSGPDLAMILYGGALKIWILGALLMNLLLPMHDGNLWMNSLAWLAGMFGLAIVTGVIESCMARLRLTRVPQLLVGAGVLSAVAVILVLNAFRVVH